eukprot:g20409.t1
MMYLLENDSGPWKLLGDGRCCTRQWAHCVEDVSEGLCSGDGYKYFKDGKCCTTSSTYFEITCVKGQPDLCSGDGWKYLGGNKCCTKDWAKCHKGATSGYCNQDGYKYLGDGMCCSSSQTHFELTCAQGYESGCPGTPGDAWRYVGQSQCCTRSWPRNHMAEGMCMDRMEKSGYPQKPQSPVRPKPEHLAEMSRLRKKMGMMSMSSNNMPNIDNQSSSEMDVNHTVSDRSTKSSIIEKNELESESETEEEELSEESDEEEGFHASQDAKDGLLSLDLHPAHGARVTQPLSFPGCKTASKMAAAAAADRDIGKRQARLVQVDLREGKLIFSAEGQTKEITLLFAEVATEVCVGPLAQELSVIAIIPEKSAHGERRCSFQKGGGPSSAAPRRPSAFPRAVKAVFSLGSTERPSNAERLGWVLTCKTEEVPIILERLGEQGCLRNHLQACYKAANNSKMGTGSFGVVAQGTNLQNGQVVAIKALNKTAKQEEVHAEVALLVRAQGPSVVKFHGCFCDVEEKGTPRWSLVFDYHSGDLYDRVAERTRMSEKESLPYLRDLLEALAHLHAKQIFHRDVKPENLLMAGELGFCAKGGSVGLCRAEDAVGSAGVDGAYFDSVKSLRGSAAASEDSNATAGPRRLGAPPTAMGYKGIDWSPISVYGTGAKHIFAIGDWGGMDGSLSPCCGRPRIIAYSGGHTPGPHVFPRSRWNRAHSALLCTHKQFVECFNTRGSSCAASCGFVPEVDMQPQFLVANVFKARAAAKNPDYILNVGDNFYWGGIEVDCGSTPMSQISGTARHQFDNIFEGIYQGPGLSNKPWLSVLGNHDWGGRQFYNGWDQQIAYTWASNRWRMPAPYWSQHVSYPDLGFTVDILMHDSNAMDAKNPEEDPEHNMCSRKHNRPDANCASAGGPSSVDSCKAPGAETAR